MLVRVGSCWFALQPFCKKTLVLGNKGNTFEANMHKYVFPYPARTNTPWKVDIPAGVAGRRIRKFFTQRETAELAAIAILDELKRRGTEGARV
ncbi:MAG TPA: hypothetical protein VFS35_04425, partial [Terrimicrobiaceae bacterium]|nr:hypothetical protein [Terrimicrobiaceae bacterium]